MIETDIYWIWLSMIPYVGPVMQKRLLEAFQTPKRVFDADEKELRALKGMNQRAFESLLTHRSLEKAKRVLNDVQRTSTELLTYDSPFYPSHAKTCPISPVVLYVCGQLRYVNEAVVIVGARRCSDYGKKVARELATQLALQEIPVLSGLAKGIDGYAHTACLQNGGYTMAFVAGGADRCYPKEHLPLYEKILKNGAILSQYPPGTKPHPKHFLQRNGLMTAWATNVVVVEAGRKSGALVTADFAEKLDRKLFAVPHRIDAPEGIGTNLLIEKGAAPYLAYSSLKIPVKKDPAPTNMEGKDILSLLREGPVTVATLSAHLELEEATLMEQLFEMEMAGTVHVRGDMVTLLN